VIWNEPWKEQARQIVVPEMARITASAPSALRPKFYRTDSFYEFPSTGSRIYLTGINEDKGEGIRGRTAHEIVNDELGSWVDTEYVLNEVLRPLLLTTGGQMIDMGTPPEDLGHVWYERKAHAIAQGRFIQRTIDTVTTISERDKQDFMESMGGRNSTAVRRELYCEPVADEARLVIPEYQEIVHVIPDDSPRPAFFDAYVGIDLGFNDHTAGIFGYWDFADQCLVIEGEWLGKGKGSKDIADGFKGVEASLWDGKRPHLRVGDNDLQQLYDLEHEHKYAVTPTRKDDKLAAITALRLRFTRGRIKIKKRCESLRYQLKVGLWNERRTDFLRGEKTGHLDALDALIYLSRNVTETRNPYPKYGSDVSYATHYIPPQSSSEGTDLGALKKAFRPFQRG
jgi:hypothetical protein